MIWKKFVLPENAPTCVVEGDKKVAPTKWWNHLWMVWYGWNTVQVFQVSRVPVGGYYVGFRDRFGTTMIRTEPVRNARFGMLIGHEGCEFFARSSPDELGATIDIRPVASLTRADVLQMNVDIL